MPALEILCTIEAIITITITIIIVAGCRYFMYLNEQINANSYSSAFVTESSNLSSGGDID